MGVEWDASEMFEELPPDPVDRCGSKFQKTKQFSKQFSLPKSNIMVMTSMSLFSERVLMVANKLRVLTLVTLGL